jgi:hypothetical protein
MRNIMTDEQNVNPTPPTAEADAPKDTGNGAGENFDFADAPVADAPQQPPKAEAPPTPAPNAAAPAAPVPPAQPPTMPEEGDDYSNRLERLGGEPAPAITPEEFARLQKQGQVNIDARGRVRTTRRSDAEAGVSLRKRRAWYG